METLPRTLNFGGIKYAVRHIVKCDTVGRKWWYCMMDTLVDKGMVCQFYHFTVEHLEDLSEHAEYTFDVGKWQYLKDGKCCGIDFSINNLSVIDSLINEIHDYQNKYERTIRNNDEYVNSVNQLIKDAATMTNDDAVLENTKLKLEILDLKRQLKINLS